MVKPPIPPWILCYLEDGPDAQFNERAGELIRKVAAACPAPTIADALFGAFPIAAVVYIPEITTYGIVRGHRLIQCSCGEVHDGGEVAVRLSDGSVWAPASAVELVMTVEPWTSEYMRDVWSRACN